MAKNLGKLMALFRCIAEKLDCVHFNMKSFDWKDKLPVFIIQLTWSLWIDPKLVQWYEPLESNSDMRSGLTIVHIFKELWLWRFFLSLRNFEIASELNTSFYLYIKDFQQNESL